MGKGSLTLGPHVMGMPVSLLPGHWRSKMGECATEVGEAVASARLSTQVGGLDSSILAAMRAAGDTADGRAPRAGT